MIFFFCTLLTSTNISRSKLLLIFHDNTFYNSLGKKEKNDRGEYEISFYYAPLLSTISIIILYKLNLIMVYALVNGLFTSS